MTRRLVALAIFCALTAPAQTRIYNTVKTKLAEGKQVFGGTVSTNDPDVYCAMANAGFDFLWIEMQHSPLTYSEVSRMIAACPNAPAIPFVRVPGAFEGDIQKATDMGALGIIIPMVDNVQEVQDAVKYAKYPPIGHRSQGGGNYGIWGKDYRNTANDNVMIVAMIENQNGVANVAEIAATPGVDVVFAASTDLGSFHNWKQGEPKYEAMVQKIHDAVLKAGKSLAGPIAWRDKPGYTFFQAPSQTSLIRTGAEVVLKGEASSGRPGVAPTEGPGH
ncbi:MAG: aldolase/citrate lyase family protein [Bryobacterales bacterium]